MDLPRIYGLSGNLHNMTIKRNVSTNSTVFLTNRGVSDKLSVECGDRKKCNTVFCPIVKI